MKPTASKQNSRTSLASIKPGTQFTSQALMQMHQSGVGIEDIDFTFFLEPRGYKPSFPRLAPRPFHRPETQTIRFSDV